MIKNIISLIKTVLVGISPKWYQLINSNVINVINNDINIIPMIINIFFIRIPPNISLSIIAIFIIYGNIN